MRRLILSMAVCILFLLMWQCETFLDPELNNPIDSTSSDYVEPKTIILEGPDYNSVVNTDDVTFRWTGNETAYEYKYLFDNLEWSDWSTDTVAHFTYLDDDYHVFSVKARNRAKVEEDSIHARIFRVDAVHGPALRFYPRHVSVAQNEVFTVEIYAEEVTDMAGVYLEIPMNPEGLEYVSHMVYSSEDAFLAKNSDNVLSVEEADETNDRLKITLARVSGTEPEVDGTGALIQMIYRYTGTTDAQIEIPSTCYYQNEAMEDIVFSELVGCVVEAK